MNSHKCDFCNVDVQRATYVRELRSKKHLENMIQDEKIIRESLFQGPIENKVKKLYNPKRFKQIAIENIELYDKQLKKQLARKDDQSKLFR